jgi:hypothetical protein
VHAVEYRGELNGVGLKTPTSYCELCNGLNELAVSSVPDPDPEIRRRELPLSL